MDSMGKISITETALRDAQQSFLATRMRTRDMLPISEMLDEVGYYSLEVWGGATFDTCIRYLNEDPWERLRALKMAMPNTPLQMDLRGQSLVGYRHYSDDIVDKFVERSAANGIKIFRIFDPLNDIRNLQKPIEAVKKAEAQAQGGISYTISPMHDNGHFVDFAMGLVSLGCDSICIKDNAGLITPNNAYDLISSIKREVNLPVNLHSHCTCGMAQMSYAHVCRAGVDILDTAISPLSGGSSQPPTESLVASLHNTRYDTDLDLELLIEIRSYFEKIMDVYAPVFNPIVARVDTRVLKHQIPGEMLSNLIYHLVDQKALDKYDAVLAEIPKVRKDLGYPPLVTPISNIVLTQAVLNVITKNRYNMVPKEIKDYIMGFFGKSPALADPKVCLKVLCDGVPITVRPADLLAPEYENAKKAVDALKLAKQDEDYLTYALYPQVALKFLQGAAVEEQLIKKPPAAAVSAPINAEPMALNVEIDGESYLVKVALAGMTIEEAKPKAPKDGLTVPMQGVIIRYKVEKGDRVEEGDVVAVFEAMKMEQNILANKSGIVKEIYINTGTTVTPGDVLMTVE